MAKLKLYQPWPDKVTLTYSVDNFSNLLKSSFPQLVMRFLLLLSKPYRPQSSDRSARDTFQLLIGMSSKFSWHAIIHLLHTRGAVAQEETRTIWQHVHQYIYIKETAWRQKICYITYESPCLYYRQHSPRTTLLKHASNCAFFDTMCCLHRPLEMCN